jgi:NAD(P)-dependent dehydrogenase (short-subunit alcohol dehydrogenase family)
MGRLDGKVALVTGAGRGIGRAISRLFASEGAKVAVLSYTPANIDRVVGEIEAAGGTALGVACDIGNAEQIEAGVDKVIAAFGQLDILVNNAFDMSSAMSSVVDLSAEQLQRQFDTGPVAYLRMMQACYPHLAARGDARVINFGSSVGIRGTAGFTPYAMAKEAIRGLTRVAAREWGPQGITVNNILPIARTDAYDASTQDDAAGNSWVPDTPLARLGSPDEDIAPVALFLASKDSQFITGYSMTPDGGYIIDSAR